jgi:ATP/maltotriose-dependent transcriptional regulator MalT
MAGAMCQDDRDGRPRLGDRETEVLVAWFQTESKVLVGRQLHIEATTVRTHLQRVRAKYAAAGRPAPTKAALVARAVQDGIISINDL